MEYYQATKGIRHILEDRAFQARKDSWETIILLSHARDVQPDHAEAIKSLENWKRDWCMATFAGDEFTGELQEAVSSLLNAFGPKLVDLGRDIWSIQLKASRKASF